MRLGENNDQLAPLTSVEEVANHVNGIIEHGKEVIHEPGKYPGISLNVGWGIEELPHEFRSTRKGVLLSGGEALNSIQIEGMSSHEALQAALDQLYGERRELPENTEGRDIYIVDGVFALGDKVARLFLGRVEPASEALNTIAKFYRYIPEAVDSHDSTTEGNKWWTSASWYNDMIKRYRANLANAEEKLLRIEKALEEAQGNAAWIPGLTDMSAQAQIFGLTIPQDGPHHRWIELPPAEPNDKSHKAWRHRDHLHDAAIRVLEQ